MRKINSRPRKHKDNHILLEQPQQPIPFASLKAGPLSRLVLVPKWESMLLLIIIGHHFFLALYPQWSVQEPSAQLLHLKLVFIAKIVLLCSQAWIILVVVHQRNHNDYAAMLQTDNTDMCILSNLFCFSLKQMVFLGWVSVCLPSTLFSVKLAASLQLYMLMNQKYLQMASKLILTVVIRRKIMFTSNVVTNHVNSLLFIVRMFCDILFPWLGFPLSLFLIEIRIAQCFIDGSENGFQNGLKYFINLVSVSLKEFQLHHVNYYVRVVGGLYSLYWDIFKDWKWYDRFLIPKTTRRDLPLYIMVIVAAVNTTIRILNTFALLEPSDRNVAEAIRRNIHTICAFERNHATKYPPKCLKGNSKSE